MVYIFRRSLIIFIMVMILTGTYSVLGSETAVAQRYFQNAQSLFVMGKYEQALPDLTLIIEKYSNTVFAGRASLMLGEYYYEIERDVDRAFEYIQKAIEISREEETVSRAYFFRGEIYSLENSVHFDINKATADYLRIINIYPNSQQSNRALYNISLLFEKSGNLNRAVWFMEKFLYSVGSRDQLDPYGVLARFYYKMIDLENALIALSKSLEFTETPDQLLRSKAYSNHILRLLKFTSKKTNHLYYAYDLNPEGDRKRIVSVSGDVKNYYYLDSRAKNLMSYNKDRIYQSTMISNLNSPVSVFIDPGGRVIVNDKRRIYIDGDMIELSKGNKPLRDIKSLAVDKDLNIYLVDDSFKAVLVFDRNGRYLREIFRGYASGDEIMTVDEYDRVFLVSRKFKTINVIATNGEFIANKPFDDRDYNINHPVDLATDFVGNLYILDREGFIWLYDYNLKPISCINLTVFQIDRPQKLGLMPDGSLSVIDNSNNVHLLK